jgi:hypothetical protein
MVMPRRAAHSVAILSLALLIACGSTDETRPIEVLFYVDALSGTRFMVDGFQAQNADHRLPGRTFEAPHFFVLENARQFQPPQRGVRGCFRTLPDCRSVEPSDPCETAPITIFLFYGTVLQERVTLQPGQCYGPDDDPQNPPDCDAPDFATSCPANDPNIVLSGPEVRFELCTSTAAESVPCVDAPASGPANVAFSANIGDFDASNFTTCSVPEAAISFCTTPAIFFLENPADRVQGIFAKLFNQNPNVSLHADLYVDGRIHTSQASDGDVIIDEGL